MIVSYILLCFTDFVIEIDGKITMGLVLIGLFMLILLIELCKILFKTLAGWVRNIRTCCRNRKVKKLTE